MESDLRGLLQVAPEQPSHSNINNVLSTQALPQGAPLANNHMNDEDDLEMAGNNEYDEELEVSDADSDDFRVQADIAKLNADVAAFKASMAADSSDEDDDLIDPRLTMASGVPRKRKAKKPKAAAPAKRRAGGGTRSNIAELSADIKLQLSRASQAWVVDNRREEALEIVLEIIRVNAETHEAWILLSSIYEEMGAMSDYIMAKCFAAHLRPRDFHGWISCALAALDDVTPGQRETNLGIAQLCYSAAIRANPKSLKARVGKANCALEAGNANVAAAEYAKVLKRKPYNMAILRNMAEAAFDARNAKKYVELARGSYEQAITYMRSGGEELQFEWSDVIIYIEMCAFLEKYAEAALALRSLARLLIGRSDESFWDKYQDDDREWDQEEDRRKEDPKHQPDRYPYAMYGPALPLDLRAKLAIYRLKLEQEEEATRHLQWLNPQDADVYNFFVDTPFVIKDLANQLFESRRVTTALEFYDLYRRLTGEPDPEILVQQGKCYLEMEDQATAEECFIAAIEIDDDNIEARYELAQMYETAQEQEEAFLLVNEALKLEQEQRLENGEDDDDGGDHMAAKARKKRRVRQKVLRDKAKARPKRARRVYVRRMANKAQREKYEESVTNNFKEKYQRVLELREQVASGDKEAEAEWMAAAQDLVDDFRSFKEFYPWDKYLSFMGYGSFFRENRRKKEREQQEQEQEQQYQQETREEDEDGQVDKEAMEAHPETSGLAAMAERLQQNLAPEDGDTTAQPSLRRSEHRGIPFDEWLDLFLEYAISLARHQKAKEAYLVCQSARDSIVYKSSDNTFLIHVAWAACAVYAADEETCVAVARFFMRNNSAATDSYRVFSALCRVCQSPVSWYASGPAQKYILRQIKAMDRTLLPPEIAESALGTWDHALPREEGQGPRHEALDVALLMLYGHILLTSTSYTYALNYFLRAAALDPGNPMVNLSTGIAYVHYAMKRQAENRQFIIVQGMHYMFEYYDARVKSGDIVERLEAHYNVARCYHLLGIYHLAVEFYGRALGEAREYQKQNGGGVGEGYELLLKGFVYESAVNMRTYSLTNGDYESARALTETWLVL
ncbi:Transcription factor tau subunit sfc4 [Cytospora mali]|uniref:Transcription factor tau subunit sfc4 n=1 Tax=Cytospora mali TaxID=578113 RepID=A0A194VJN7_CYTMA|nr:Transcription factor tau subunit sfc4 [Valsa mali]